KYSNGKGAGIEYSGSFGTSASTSNLIYLAFPLETTANDEAFNQIISNSIFYFNSFPVSTEHANKITTFKLEQNYPNPFNPSTKISYQLRNAGHVSLIVYDVLGNEVATLVNEKQTRGAYDVNFNASNLTSGIYFYKITTANFSQVRKMILVR
ncbi:MAG: T9SS type A sorting domain-containing protein, partial [Ignavibacteriae bacterium]|nr:T9SS type A sorting domain-containing protein [Ignavibacteriota bacterium]